MTPDWIVRSEAPGDEAAIAELIAQAFAGGAHSDGSEGAIVARLRAADALAVSLVADRAGAIAGHAAFSPVTVEHGAGRWFGLAPVAVRPGLQRQGIGAALIGEGLERLRRTGAAGCVVLGDPAYYGRFGFRHDPALVYADVPAGYFQRLAFASAVPSGTVRYHAGFG